MSAQFQNIFKATFPYHWGEFDFSNYYWRKSVEGIIIKGFITRIMAFFLEQKKRVNSRKKVNEKASLRHQNK